MKPKPAAGVRVPPPCLRSNGKKLQGRVPLRVGVNGQLKLTWNVPNQNNLIGAFFYSQSFVLNSRANPAGAITSNALRTTISL